MPDNKPVCALVAKTNTDAILIATFLQDRGIDAKAVQDNSLPGVYLPEIIRPKVFVPPGQLTAAREFIAGFDSGQVASGSTTNCCYHCGAECATDDRGCPECGKKLDLNTDDVAYDGPATVADIRFMKQKKIPTSVMVFFLVVVFLLVVELTFRFFTGGI